MDMAGAGAVLAAIPPRCGPSTADRRHRLPDVHRQHAVGVGDGSSATYSPFTAAPPSKSRTPTPRVDWCWPTLWSLAAEEAPDAIVDIATLTGRRPETLGLRHRRRVRQRPGRSSIRPAPPRRVTDEPIWQLPLEHRYRDQLDSDFADISNMGGKSPRRGRTVPRRLRRGHPGGHFDIAGHHAGRRRRCLASEGATGFGTRILIELARGFTPVQASAPAG